MVSTSVSSVQKCQEHINTITRVFIASFFYLFAIVTTALRYLTWANKGVTLTVCACYFDSGGDDGK